MPQILSFATPDRQIRSCAKIHQLLDAVWLAAGRSVTAFVALDVDAVLSHQLLVQLCEKRNLRLDTYPAVDWKVVVERLEQHEGEDDLDIPALIVLINCGANANVGCVTHSCSRRS